jgi:hypothetical protein
VQYQIFLRERNSLFLPWPRIYARNFETVIPGTAVGTLTFGSGTHAVPVRFTILPSATIGTTIVEIESASVQMSCLIGGDRSTCSASGCRRRGVQVMVAPRHRISLLHPTLDPFSKHLRRPHRRRRPEHYNITLIVSINSINSREQMTVSHIT